MVRLYLLSMAIAVLAGLAAAASSPPAGGRDPLRAGPAGPLDAAVGKALFDRQWVGAPASTAAADGLGPLFNARSCAACHRGGGGARVRAERGEIEVRGLVVRVAGPDGAPHPELGRQIQDHALPGLPAEARVAAALQGDALLVTTTLLHEPGTPALFDIRIAPSLRGKAMLDRVDAAAILARADPGDRDGDGISGRPNLVPDGKGGLALGRYGSKASAASLAEQVADAAALDIGLSSPLARHPFGDCTAGQAECLLRPTGRSPISDGEEISAEVVRLMASYVASLDGPPVDRDSEGFGLFVATGCAACHVPTLPARDGTDVQLFSDVLLHDLGPGNASAIREGRAAPAEWRTAPLRDLDPANGERRYLHDGRAATLSAAIAFHGGEASAARRAFFQRDGHDRRLLLDFLARL